MNKKSGYNSKYNYYKYKKHSKKLPCHIDLPEFIPLNSRKSEKNTESLLPSTESASYSNNSFKYVNSNNHLLSPKQETIAICGNNYYRNPQTFHPENVQKQKILQKLENVQHQKIHFRSRSPHSSESSYDICEDYRKEYYSVYRRNSYSVFQRLDVRESQKMCEKPPKVQKHSPSYENNEIMDEKYKQSYPIRISEDENARNLTALFHCSGECDRYQTMINNNDLKQADLISAIQNLEHEQQKLKHHCNGLKYTVQSYFREISKLEALVLFQSQELDTLKRKLYSIQ